VPAQEIRLIHPARGHSMKKLFFAALLALPVFAVSARADGCGCGCWFPSRVDARFDFHFKVAGPGDYSVGQLGPWYLYWPMEAHFQAPAPTGYPYWPAPMGLPPQTAAAYGAPAAGNFQPAAYSGATPSYWGR
jgi:hypothetical protein